MIIWPASLIVTAAPPVEDNADKMQEALRKYYYNEGEKQRLAEIGGVQVNIEKFKRKPKNANRKMLRERRKKVSKFERRLRELKTMKGKYPTRLRIQDIAPGTAGMLVFYVPDFLDIKAGFRPAPMRVVEIIDGENMVARITIDVGKRLGEIWLSGFPTAKFSDGEHLPPLESPVAITGETRDHLGDLVFVVTPFDPSPPKSKKPKPLGSLPKSSTP